MRITPILPVGISPQPLVKFLTEVVRSLKLLPDVQCYTSVVTWKVPFNLSIPPSYPLPRQGPPKIVRLGRAVLVSSPITPVYWGASTTWVWLGNNAVSILDQEGLVEDVKYELTYEVID